MFESIFFLQFSGIIAAADPFAVGDFLFNPIVLVVAVGRALAQVKRTFRNSKYTFNTIFRLPSSSLLLFP